MCWAMALRMCVTGTISSPCPAAAAGIAGAGAGAAGAAPGAAAGAPAPRDATKLNTSAFVIRPPVPVPGT
jgi:hypothetical protein